MKRLFTVLLCLVTLVTFSTGPARAYTPPAPDAALQALKQAATGPLQIEYTSNSGVPTFILGEIPVRESDPEQAAVRFFNEHGAAFKMQNPADEMAVQRVESDDSGATHVRFQQTVNGVPVFGAQMIVHLADQKIVAVNGQYLPDLELDTSPTLTREEALALALTDLDDPQAEYRAQNSELAVYVNDGKPFLTWKLNLFSGVKLGNWFYFVDAHDGHFVHVLNQLDTAKSIRIYTANNQEVLPGTLVCGTGTGNTTCSGQDAATVGAYTNAGKTYDYYYNAFGRDSYDGHGTPLISTVHFGSNYDNAFWNGTQMAYGDGDIYSQAFDVVAHELTHGVTSATSDLIYEHQPGALNESWSDVMAVLAGCSTHTGQADCNWYMGDDLNNGIIRDVSNPPAYEQPDQWSEYRWLPLAADQGGVHINSGIPNKAAFLLIAGGYFGGVTVTGIGYTKTEQIYYDTMAYYLTPASNFMDAKSLTYAACLSNVGTFGITSTNCNSVLTAWQAVGVGSGVVTPPSPYRRYIPINLRPVPTCAETSHLANGGFESQWASWNHSSSAEIIDFARDGGGTYSLLLGEALSENETVYQNFATPTTSPYMQIQFYTAVSSEDSQASIYDYLTLQLLNSSGTALAEELSIIDNRYGGGPGTFYQVSPWYRVTLIYNEVLNHNLRLQLRSVTDSSDRTAFFIDDVSVKARCTRYVAPEAQVLNPAPGVQIIIEPAPEYQPGMWTSWTR